MNEFRKQPETPFTPTANVKKTPFLVIDIILIAAAVFLMISGGRPLSAAAIIGITALAICGAWIAIWPWIRETNVQLGKIETEQFKSIETSAAEMGSAADSIHSSIAELVQIRTALEESSRNAANLPASISKAANQLEARAAQVSTYEKGALEMEVSKLRRTEKELLDSEIQLLHQILALTQAGLKSQQPQIIKQMQLFRGVCLDIANRAGVQLSIPKVNEIFDSQAHQLPPDASAPVGSAKITHILLPGFLYQGQIIHKPIVLTDQNPLPTSQNAPSEQMNNTNHISTMPTLSPEPPRQTSSSEPNPTSPTQNTTSSFTPAEPLSEHLDHLEEIPEEIHQISKDASLKLVESGTYVEAGTEVVKDIYTHIAGIVEIKEFNDIIHEIVVRPGELHTLDSINDLKVGEGEVVKAGTVVAGKIKAKVDSIVTIVENESDLMEIDDLDEDLSEDTLEDDSIEGKPVQILIRPIQAFDIEQKDVSIKFSATDDAIELIPITQVQFKDGARVRNLDGAVLTRTSLVLSMSGYISHLKGMVELDKKGDLKIVVLETLIVRREQEDSSRGLSSTQTELLVKNGQVIEPKTPVTKTQVLAVNDSVASINSKDKDLRRLLLVSDNYEETIETTSKPTVKAGDFVTIDSKISENEVSNFSGKVVKVSAKSVTLRVGRPHLISPGALLQVDNSALILRGDLLATLVFERQKTGDIVQGLPRVEELLEARKPKDSAIAAEEDGVAIIEYEDDTPRLFIENENGRVEIKYPIEASVIVNDKQKIHKGDALTSGPMNPHDVIRLKGANAAQQYLVDEVQRVYRSQGVEISDKHVEVIVRQMIKKVKVLDSGTTRLLPGELVEIKTIEAENAKARENGGQEATYEALLLGITKASLNTESFISAASFQETTRILTEAAVEGKKDLLRGLKENVIIGRLIPAGTGYYHLINASEEKEKEAQKRAAQKHQARKPSAILEEIEGMFGVVDPDMQF